MTWFLCAAGGVIVAGGAFAVWQLHRKLDRHHAEVTAKAAIRHAELLAAVKAAATAGEDAAKLLAAVKTAPAARRPRTAGGKDTP